MRMSINSPTPPATLKTNSFLTNILVPVALLLVLGATAVPFFLREVELARAAFPYVFTAGAVLLLIARIFTPYRGSDLRLKRLHRIDQRASHSAHIRISKRMGADGNTGRATESDESVFLLYR